MGTTHYVLALTSAGPPQCRPRRLTGGAGQTDIDSGLIQSFEFSEP